MVNIVHDMHDPRVARALLAGGLVVLRTDTLYGVVARADDPDAVERVYTAKRRDARKSCIVLLDDPSSSYGHSDELSTDIAQYHDRPTSFLIQAASAPPHLLRENNDIAYRVPNDASLRQLIAITGPLVAPSANPEGEPPARTIQEAVDYFQDNVDVYVDGGDVPLDMQPSRIMRIHADGSYEQLR